MLIDKQKFLQCSIDGFNDACEDRSDWWLGLTKKERLEEAKKHIAEMEKIYYGFECIEKFIQANCLRD